VTRVNGTVPRLSVAPGRKGFKAELQELRERMGGLGLGHGQIAGEIARRYRVRPREAYRLAHGGRWGRQRPSSTPARPTWAPTREDWPAWPQTGCVSTRSGRTASDGPRSTFWSCWRRSTRPGCWTCWIWPTASTCHRATGSPSSSPGKQPPSEAGVSTPTRAARDSGQPGTGPPGLVPGPPLASVQGLSLSSPYVPGRLVIEVTDPALSAGQHGGEGASAVAALVVQTTVGSHRPTPHELRRAHLENPGSSHPATQRKESLWPAGRAQYQPHGHVVVLALPRAEPTPSLGLRPPDLRAAPGRAWLRCRFRPPRIGAPT